MVTQSAHRSQYYRVVKHESLYESFGEFRKLIIVTVGSTSTVGAGSPRLSQTRLPRSGIPLRFCKNASSFSKHIEQGCAGDAAGAMIPLSGRCSTKTINTRGTHLLLRVGTTEYCMHKRCWITRVSALANPSTRTMSCSQRLHCSNRGIISNCIIPQHNATLTSPLYSYQSCFHLPSWAPVNN